MSDMKFSNEDLRIIDCAVETMIAFLEQSKLIIKHPSVTRNRTSGIVGIYVDDFVVNPKVYLCHPKSKKKFLVCYPDIFSDSRGLSEIFENAQIIQMIGQANVGAYFPKNFLKDKLSDRYPEISDIICKKMKERKVLTRFYDETQCEWDRCRHEKRTLLAGYFSNSKKKNKIRSVFQEQLSNYLIGADSVRILEADVLIKLFQVDDKELTKLADFVRNHRKELRFISNEDIEDALGTSQVKCVMDK